MAGENQSGLSFLIVMIKSINNLQPFDAHFLEIFDSVVRVRGWGLSQ